MEIKPINPKLTQQQLAKELGYSDSTVKRSSTDINMNCPYGGPSEAQRFPEESSYE